RGLPAVLAMQYSITDHAAIEFSRAFYDVLAEGLAVDTAVVEARKAVSFAVSNTIEWGTPVLYMRAPDGKIFDIAHAQPLPKKAAPQPQAAPPPRPVVEKKKPITTPQQPPPKATKISSRTWLVSGIVLTVAVLTWLIIQYDDWNQPTKQTPPQTKTRLSPLDSLYLKHVADGDELFKRNEFVKAKQKYQQALTQKPGDANVAAKLKACDQKLSEAERDKLYKQYCSDGNALYQQKKYTEARNKFESALLQKPNDGYATARKQACDERLAEQQTSYETYKAAGDRLFKQGEYVRAKDQYEQALALRENDAYVAKQMRECDRLQAAATAKRAQPQETPTTSAPVGMVLIPAGTFTMGSNDYGDEKPLHQVSVAAFYMDKYEVTVAQYQKFLVANPAQDRPNNWTEQLQNTNRPVVNVSWHDAVAYCEWMSKQRGKRVRLPTEAEWEYAARGGLSGKKYPWGDDISTSNANFYSSDKTNALQDVGRYSPNNYGLYDMAGNVWEWCSSLYKPYPYKRDDGRESLSTIEPRVLRGGSWLNYPNYLRCANRYSYVPSDRYDLIGFRCSQDVR
ncbi:MAG: SUMF1/EgtB/PvdO family nonheme iron enzyme, partial [candidate division KSB1 bacterium]